MEKDLQRAIRESLGCKYNSTLDHALKPQYLPTRSEEEEWNNIDILCNIYCTLSQSTGAVEIVATDPELIFLWRLLKVQRNRKLHSFIYSEINGVCNFKAFWASQCHSTHNDGYAADDQDALNEEVNNRLPDQPSNTAKHLAVKQLGLLPDENPLEVQLLMAVGTGLFVPYNN